MRRVLLLSLLLLVAGAPAAWSADGAGLFAADCSRCHGSTGAGLPGKGPSLEGVGARAADFYLRTGYMPLGNSADQPERSRVLYNEEQIRAIVKYVAALGRGPAIPSPQWRAASVCGRNEALHRPLRRLSPDRRPGGLRHRRSGAAARQRNAPADRGSGADRAVSDAALLPGHDLARSAERHRRLRPVHEASSGSRRGADRPARPVARGNGRPGCSRCRCSLPSVWSWERGSSHDQAEGLARRRRRAARRPPATAAARVTPRRKDRSARGSRPPRRECRHRTVRARVGRSRSVHRDLRARPPLPPDAVARPRPRARRLRSSRSPAG